MANVSETHSHLGRSRDYQDLEDYESPEEYADQDDERTVKFLMFTYHVLAPSPMIAGEEVIMERTAHRGDVVYTDELGPVYLEKGERLGAFFTSDELAAIKSGKLNPALPEGQQAIEPAEGEGADATFTELGAHEMAEYLEANKPNVNDTLALVGADPDAARRLLEAENIVTGGDPRNGVEQGVQRIIAENS